MLTTLLKLYFNFFYIGAFAFGGGYTMIPLFQQVVVEYGWMTIADFTDMIAISQMTPGPIAINMATFIGYRTAGVAGSLMATLGVCTPSFVLVTVLIRFVMLFEEKPVVINVLRVLRPTVAGLIAAAAWIIAVNSSLVDIEAFRASGEVMALFDLLSTVLAAAIIYAIANFKKHPILYVLFAGVIGAVLM